MQEERRQESERDEAQDEDDQDLRSEGRAGELIRGGRTSRSTVTPMRRGRTRDELYEEAKALNIEGRSKMSKDELEQAVDRRRGRKR